MKKLTLSCVAAASLALAACGGGGSPPAATDAVPDSASQSSQGMVDYLLALAKDKSETKEALDVSKWIAPTSETEEPVALP
jgi:predicted small lipoprotein YifL